MSELAIALHRWFPHGGLQRIAADVAAGARDRGWPVRLITARADAPPPDGIRLDLVPVAGRTNHARAAAFGQALVERRERQSGAVVLGMDKLPGVDLHLAVDTCFAARARARHGPLRHLLPRDRTFTALEGAVFRPGRPAEVLLLAEAQATAFRRSWGTEPQRMRVLPPALGEDRRAGADAEERRVRTRAALGIDEQPLLLCLGSDFRRKGFDRVVAALPDLPGTRLLVAGADDPRRLRRLARRRGVGERVRVDGGRNDVPDLLQAADLLVHPARSEAAGMVLVEALAAGLAVVTVDTCGYADHVRRAGGGEVLSGPLGPGQLAGAIRRALEVPADERRRAALAWASRLPRDAFRHAVLDRVAEHMGR